MKGIILCENAWVNPCRSAGNNVIQSQLADFIRLRRALFRRMRRHWIDFGTPGFPLEMELIPPRTFQLNSRVPAPPGNIIHLCAATPSFPFLRDGQCEAGKIIGNQVNLLAYQIRLEGGGKAGTWASNPASKSSSLAIDPCNHSRDSVRFAVSICWEVV